MVRIEDIIEIRKAEVFDRGYEIVFPENKIIWLTKRRTIAGLLLLIKYEVCSEEDLVGANNRLQEVKTILAGKYNPTWIKDRYGDANKPFSELWTEEGFSCIRAEGLRGNRQYVLRKEDHDLLFNPSAKFIREQIGNSEKQIILQQQINKCNLCGAILKESAMIQRHTYAKDRVTLEFDHRIPVDRGGDSNIMNYQALCHYCNKSKRQMCFICSETCNKNCALVSPETSSIVLATGEDISDRLK
ncbi:MAG: HNH endonuclease signature motif containing protein [Anaerovoracaceae bacterium]